MLYIVHNSATVEIVDMQHPTSEELPTGMSILANGLALVLTNYADGSSVSIALTRVCVWFCLSVCLSRW